MADKKIVVGKTPAIYEDDSLTMIVQAMDFIETWVTKPIGADFKVSAVSNNRNFAVVDHLYQFNETERRKQLTAHLINKFKIPMDDRINKLPGSYLTFALQNIILNAQIVAPYLIPGRLNSDLCSALYCLPSYWVTYYHLDYMIDDENKQQKPDYKYRALMLKRIQECLGLAIRNILNQNEFLRPSQYVIVNATTSMSEKATLYTDCTNLYKWISKGNTLSDLCAHWINEHRNPLA